MGKNLHFCTTAKLMNVIVIIIIIQHLFSALFTNKHALKRYLNRYDGMTKYYSCRDAA